MRSRRGALVAGLTLLTVPVVLASLAWACTSSKVVYVNGMPQEANFANALANPGAWQSVPAGGSVSIRGSAWESGTVVVFWESRNGQVLRRADADPQAGGFAATVTIPPRTTPGQHLLVVVGQSSGDTENVFSIPLRVTAPVVNDPGPGPVLDPTPTPDPTPIPGVTPASGGTAPAAAAAVAEDTSVFEPADAPASADRVAAPRSRGAAVVPGRTGSAAVAAPAGAPAADGATAAPVPGATEVAPVVPSARAAGSDLWSGFSTGTDQRGASLVDTGAAPGSGGSMGTGLAVLGIGLVALLAGLGIALRRRPVKVVSED